MSIVIIAVDRGGCTDRGPARHRRVGQPHVAMLHATHGPAGAQHPAA